MRRTAAALAVVALAAGCGGSGSGGRATVYAAASLTDVFPQIDAKARYSFAGSNELAAQIEQGATPDVYASANEKLMDELRAKGLVEEPSVFATNRLVVAVPPSNPAHVESAADLARPGVKVVLAEPGVPAGDYAREALGTLGLDVRPVSEEPDVRSVLAKVALGEADAGIVYATDARTAKVKVVELPERAQVRARYTIAVVADAPDPAAAKRFVDAVEGAEGRKALQAAGFGLL